MTEAKKKIVLEHFLNNVSINHIVFLLDYKYRIDEITEVIRDTIKQITIERDVISDRCTQLEDAFNDENERLVKEVIL